MVMTPVKTPLQPNVPIAPGVPSVKRDPLVIVNQIQLLAADIITVAQSFQGPQWGIFTLGGRPLVIPDTIESVDHRAEARISDYPVEGGGFQSYDKVILPHDTRVVMVCDGSNMSRTNFLANLEQARISLDFFVVVTPDVTYPNVNIIHYDYRRSRQRGATMIYADVWLEEVRISGTTQFVDTKAPQSQVDVNRGTVQPETPPAGVTKPPVPPLSEPPLPVPPIPPVNVFPFD